ncbi:MAG: transporter ATP-binding protein [Hyphomicrobiales bacterium]|nr:transporter ATP-binding protein [Hyphomicrobiales bacterium]
MQPPLIEIASLCLRRGEALALDDVSLTIPQGAFVSLVGPSGAGKTTLLKCVNRLLEPTSGRIAIDGRDLAAHDPVELRRSIGYVFQGVGLFPHMSVAENIGVTPRLQGAPRAQIEARVAELLGLVELPADFGARMPQQLSGGQRQRVGLARALAAEPRVVLMDEPFGALDPVTRDNLARMYKSLHERLGLTTLMVTHDMMEALLMSHRIVVLADGRVQADAAPAELLRSRDPVVADMANLPRRHAERIAAMAQANGAPS